MAALRTILSLVIVAASLAIAQSDDPPKPDIPAADPMLGTEAGQVRDDNGLKMKLVWCPPGVFTMGQADEKVYGQAENITPVKVFLSHGYWLGKYEVTHAEWKQVMKAEPWKLGISKEGDDFPATSVNWDDAMEFCRKLTEQERNAGRLADGWEYALPTEAQWERACRARTDTKFSFGDDESKLGDYAWFADKNAARVGETYPHRVGQKKPNPWGLHDMHGNVSEWCRDYYAEKLPGGRDPEVTEKGSGRTRRGGGWVSQAAKCRSSSRFEFPPSYPSVTLGFRIALVPVQQAK